MSVGIITTVHTYTHFLPGWCESIAALTTQPDAVVIAATNPTDVAPLLTIDATVVQAGSAFSFGGYLNTATAACPTDWVAWIGVDDRYRPHALDDVDRDDADVVAFGMQYEQGGTWMPNVTHIDMAANYVPCGSPFRRALWERLPFQPHLAPFEDWALWAGFAHLGARFTTTGRIDFDYAQHADQIVPPMEPTRTRIAEWLTTLEDA